MFINSPKRAFNAGRESREQGNPIFIHPKMKSELIEHFRRGWLMADGIDRMIVRPRKMQLARALTPELAPCDGQRIKAAIEVANRRSINYLCNRYKVNPSDVINYALSYFGPIVEELKKDNSIFNKKNPKQATTLQVSVDA